MKQIKSCLKLLLEVRCVTISKRIYLSGTFKNTFKENAAQVFVSKSEDIYKNLALEEWLYETQDLRYKSVLLMWQNGPTVVIGRHQNPWLECDVNTICESGVKLARRKSGGGCVYHDLGNLNCSFLLAKNKYNRRRNLDLVVDAVTQKWDIDLSVNTREDIVLEGIYKVSGTASKLGRDNTYHHFTLLHDVNKEHLEKMLNSPMNMSSELDIIPISTPLSGGGISPAQALLVFTALKTTILQIGVLSKASQSLPSRIRNLREIHPSITFRSLVDQIGHQFYSQHGIQGDIHWVDPDDEDLFPGLALYRNALEEWEWIYGKTPKFSIHKTFIYTSDDETVLNIKFNIEKGRIVICDILCNYKDLSVQRMITGLQKELMNTRLWKPDLNKLLLHISETSSCTTENRDVETLKKWIILCCKMTLNV